MVTTWSGLGPSYSVVIALQMKTTREALMATGMAEDMYSVVLAIGVGRGPLRGCGSYRGKLRTTTDVFDATGIGLGNIECCNGYKGRLRSVRVLWLLIG